LTECKLTARITAPIAGFKESLHDMETERRDRKGEKMTESRKWEGLK